MKLQWLWEPPGGSQPASQSFQFGEEEHNLSRLFVFLRDYISKQQQETKQLRWLCFSGLLQNVPGYSRTHQLFLGQTQICECRKNPRPPPLQSAVNNNKTINICKHESKRLQTSQFYYPNELMRLSWASHDIHNETSPSDHSLKTQMGFTIKAPRNFLLLTN